MQNNNHDFHLVITKELKDKIIDLSNELNKSVSGTAVYIIERTLNAYKKQIYKKDEVSGFSAYQNIYWDKDIHVYFDKNTFRKIKHLCDVYFAFSMAIVVRWLFSYYFNNVYDIEKKLEKDLDEIDNEVEYYEKKLKCWSKNNNAKQLSDKFYYQLTFNEKFSIIGFNFTMTG